MHYINRTTAEHFSGDPLHLPWPKEDCICYAKLETPPAEVLAVEACYRVVEGDKVRVATAEERAEIDARLELSRLPELKAEKLADLDRLQAAAETQGVTVGNVQLASSEYDQRRLATLLVGINEAIALGLYSSESLVEITDANNRDIPLTVGQFKMLAVGYVGECLKQRKMYRELRANIESAVTPAELKTIVF